MTAFIPNQANIISAASQNECVYSDKTCGLECETETWVSIVIASVLGATSAGCLVFLCSLLFCKVRKCVHDRQIENVRCDDEGERLVERVGEPDVEHRANDEQPHEHEEGELPGGEYGHQ